MPSVSIRLFAIVVVFFGLLQTLSAQPPADKAAEMLLADARRAYNEKKYPEAALRFRDFVTKYGQHKEVPAARYSLALCLIEGPGKYYGGASEQLEQLAANKDFPDHPFVLYYLALSQRSLGIQALAQDKARAQARFAEAAKYYAAAMSAFAARVKEKPAEAKGLPVDLEWAARARCDLADVQLRLLKPKEARDTVQPLVEEKAWTASRHRLLGLYYHGFASFQLKDFNAAGRSLSQLTPFTDPFFGTHARYLLARVHQLEQERPEAMGHYEGLLAEYAKQKTQAVETLRDPSRYKNDPNEKARLESLVRDPAPEYVRRAGFYLGVMQHEDGKFGEAAGRLGAFVRDNPASPLLPEAQLRLGICQVQSKQYAEAQKTLTPLIKKEPRLADRCHFWIGKAQVGEAGDPATNKGYAEKLKHALASFHAALAATEPQFKTDPEAATRRGELLLELGDTLQTTKQYKDAVAAYNQILNEKLLPPREEEVIQHVITALHLNGDYAESDKVCVRFRDKFPQSTLLPAVLFRHAENAYFMALAAQKKQNSADMARWTDTAIERYTVVVEKYPEFPYASVARHGLAMAHYRKGNLDKAKEMLASIPVADRAGELAAVPYQIAEIVIRMAPTNTDDAVSAGRLEEAMKEAIELLQSYAGANPSGPLTPDAYLKIGHCHGRMAALIVQSQEQQKELASARKAYEQVVNQFKKHELYPQAVFERAKVLALMRDVNGAMNELRRFTTDPLKNAPIAPLAQLHLATLYRGQNRAKDAVTLLAQTRQNYETTLRNDPKRTDWIPLVQYQHGVALRETGKLPEARALFDEIVRQWPNHSQALEAALRSGQCHKEEGQAITAEGRKRLANAGNRIEEQAAAKKLIDDGNEQIRAAARHFVAQAQQMKEKQPESPLRARMIYEAAWAYRTLAEQEIDSARGKLMAEQWQTLKEEVAKKTPKGKQPLVVPKPDATLAAVAVQPSEKAVRAQYLMLIEEFPDLAINADARFELAELVAERDGHDEAIKLLRSAIDKEPPPELTEKIRLRLGVCLMAKGDTKAALTQFNVVLKNPKSPLFAQATYRAGECLMHTGDFAEATKRFAVFRDQGPYQNLSGLTDRALLRLGHALEKQKQWEPSRKTFEQVVNRFPQSPWINDARYGIAWAQQQQSQFDQAIAQYKQVANLATELGARAQLNLGRCKLAQKKYAEASIALLVVPDAFDYPHLNAQALLEAAKALTENKEKARAIEVLESLLRDYPAADSADAAKKHLAELKKG